MIDMQDSMELQILRLYYNNRDYQPFGLLPVENPLSYIHPRKVDGVQKIIEIAPDWVELIVVFGSSTDDTHHAFSDLDLAIIPDDSEFLFKREVRKLQLPYSVDIVGFDSLSSLVEQGKEQSSAAFDVLKRGVPIYSKYFPIRMVKSDV